MAIFTKEAREADAPSRKWEVYAPTREGREPVFSMAAEPMASVRVNGKMALNRKALAELGNPERVTLVYDKENMTIGVRRQQDPTQPSLKVQSKGGRERYGIAEINAEGLFKVLGWKPKSASRHLAFLEGDILVIEL